MSSRWYPRANQPWTVAEDRRLTCAVAKVMQLDRAARRRAWVALAKRMGRTVEAVKTRSVGLQTGLRLMVGRC